MRSNPARHHHDVVDPHRATGRLGDVILGGQDGLVNVLGVLLGVAAATGSARVVIVAALSAAIAESVSMAAVAYTTNVAEGERYRSERAREMRHIAEVPEIERDEIRAMFVRKGFSGDLLERVVRTITNDPEVWVAVMMADEHQLFPVSRGASLRSAVVVGVAALVGSLLPLAPFAFLSVYPASIASVVLAAVVLFAFGAYKARLTIGHPIRGGLELALIGTVTALLGYLVGVALRVP
jgi:VIT1/CCC1 family predicted Fe2+/Mn2+ transporter